MPGKPVMVGVDGSPESVKAAAFAWRLAAAARAECRLLHAVPDAWLADYPGLPAPSRDVLDDVLEASRQRITQSLSGAVPVAVGEKLDVRFGRAELVLRAAAERSRAQLVVLGGKHHTVLGRTFGGSTAHHLVRTLDRPLLVVGATVPAHRVLAAVDLSPAARPTLALARRVASLLDAELRVVHVVEPVRLPLTIGLVVDEDEVYRRSVEAFERMGHGVGERVVRRGEAVQTLAAEVTAWGADLLVMGSHGKGWVDRMLIGSVTERLLSLLPVSVLVVPTGTPQRVPRMKARAPAARRRRGVTV